MEALNIALTQMVIWILRLGKRGSETWVVIWRFMGERWSTIWLKRWWGYGGFTARGQIYARPNLPLPSSISSGTPNGGRSNKEGLRGFDSLLDLQMNQIVGMPWRDAALDMDSLGMTLQAQMITQEIARWSCEHPDATTREVLRRTAKRLKA